MNYKWLHLSFLMIFLGTFSALVTCKKNETGCKFHRKRTGKNKNQLSWGHNDVVFFVNLPNAMALFICSRQSNRFSLTISDKSKAITGVLGENITLPCTVTGEGYSPFYNPISWYKKLPNGNLKQINTLAVVGEPFGVTNRYSIGYFQNAGEVPKIQMPLYLSKLTGAENGVFICELQSKTGVLGNVTYTVTIPAPITDLVLTGNVSDADVDSSLDEVEQKITFTFDELKPYHISCKSTGGSPKPALKMFRGKVDITDEFQLKETENMLGEEGLQMAQYEVELVNNEYRVTKDMRGENLRCVAKIHRQPDLKKSVSAMADVRYAPKFDCATNFAAAVGTKNFQIECKVSGNPAVELESIKWHLSGGGHNLTSDGVMGPYTSNYSMDVENGDIKVMLTIDQVSEVSYQTYNLNARNDIAEVQHQMALSEKMPITTTTTKKPEKNPDYNEVGKPGAATGKANTQIFQFTTIVFLLSIVYMTLGHSL